MTKDEAEVAVFAFVLAWLLCGWVTFNIYLAGEPLSPIYLAVAAVLPWMPRLR